MRCLGKLFCFAFFMCWIYSCVHLLDNTMWKCYFLSHVWLFATPQTILHLCPQNLPGKNTGVGCHFNLQEIFPTQGLNPGLLHCRQMLYCLSHQGSPIMLSHLNISSFKMKFFWLLKYSSFPEIMILVLSIIAFSRVTPAPLLLCH